MYDRSEDMRSVFLIYIQCLLTFCLALAFVPVSGQGQIDSLVAALNDSKADSSKVKVLNQLFKVYEYSDDAKAKEVLDQALDLAKRSGYKKGLGITYINMGYFAEDKSDYPEALKNYFSALKVREEIGDKMGVSDAYNNIGLINAYQGNYPEALRNHFLALKIREVIKDKIGIAASYNNIGMVYYFEQDYELALTNYFTSLALKKSAGDKRGVASGHINIGNIYFVQDNYEKALENYFASLKLNEELGSKKGIAFVYNNIGSTYAKQANCEKDVSSRAAKLKDALESYFLSVQLREETGDKAGLASCYINIGTAYVSLKKLKEAEMYLRMAEELSKEIGYREIQRDAYSQLAVLDSTRGDFRAAYRNFKLFISYRDSLNNEESRKKTIQNQMNFDFEKKEAIAEAEHKKELENQELIANEKSRKQKIVLSLVSCFLLLVVIFAGFIFRSLRTTKKQKKIIEEQKNVVEQQKAEVELQKSIVEEHQKDIIDSITYARRIQRSLLPTEKYIESSLFRLNSTKKSKGE